MDPVKGAAGLGAVALVVGGGYALKGGLDNWTPEHSFLSEMDRFKEVYTEKTFGRIYGKYLIDPNKDEAWWNKQYKDVWSKDYEPQAASTVQTNDSLSVEFKKTEKVDKAFGASGDTKALNRVCEIAYKKDSKEHIKPESGSDSTKQKYREAIWKYCSIFGKELLTVKDGGGNSLDAGKIGKAKEAVLASVNSPNNNEFWKRRQKEFFYGGDNKEGIGKDADKEKEFGQLYKEKDSKSETEGALKGVCENVYGKATSETALQTEAVKYCGLIEEIPTEAKP
ncbi:hypothetical protein MHSWG343_05210 [Candidatus Mycoplasma haematohominis]|uniref:Uncharacterized protein n=1 Tax=Candidatus Mycoplasma haematohominis TaxID=1494318 RepID=A0A478FR93_9MOLU|nr:hypothetical protein MHSWG343_05210 [Candidatus Mycoplasma haemohominis]